MDTRQRTMRRVAAVGGAVLAAGLAGLVALLVNLGILRAAGEPSGPGRLPAIPIVRIERPARPRIAPTPASSAATERDRDRGVEKEHEFGATDDD